MENEVGTPQYEVVVRRGGSDILVIGIFYSTTNSADMVVGYDDPLIKELCAELLVNVGHAISDAGREWLHGVDLRLTPLDNATATDDVNDIPF